MAASFQLPADRPRRGLAPRRGRRGAADHRGGLRALADLQPTETAHLMRFDHHLHTKRHSPDSDIDPLDLIEPARQIGLDGLVITEHDYQWEPGELADLANRAAPLRVFSGAE